MDRLIGRKEELTILDDILKSRKSEFLAIYGRRRVGKTFLIRRYLEKQKCIFLHVTGIKDGILAEQISHVTKEIGKTFYSSAELVIKDRWIDVFEQLTDAIATIPKTKKVVLFFDELPWMATKRSKLIQAIDHYWNRYWSFDSRLKFIVCGSASSWILEKLIHNKGGLYNRITQIIKLEPFTLKETKIFLNNMNIKLSNKQVVQLYMITGGIPLYLLHIKKSLSIIHNIDRLCFSSSGLLFKEFDELFSALFDESEVYEELIKIIASQRYGISQERLIEKSTKASKGGRVVKRLKELEEAGFIISFVPYKHKDKGKYYRIFDEYTMFYMSWINPVKETIRNRRGVRNYWQTKVKHPSWFSWAGYAFEAICYKHIASILQTLNISFGAEIASWRYTPRKKSDEFGVQIDLLFDRYDDAITICEIKYTNNSFTIDKKYAQELLRKREVFRKQLRTNKQIFIAMISANGLKSTIYAEDLIANVVTLDDLFRE